MMVNIEMGDEESHKVPPIDVLIKTCHSAYMDPNGPLSEAFSRKTYYKVNIYFTWLLLRTKITPNQVTLLSMFFGLFACVFLTMSSWYPIVGVALFQLWFIFDIVDGDIARYRKICSMSGAFLDRLNTAIVDPLMYASLAYGTYLRLDNIDVLFFGFSAAISILLFKMVFAYLHVAILEPIMHRKHAEMITLPKSVDEKDTMLTEYFDYQPSSFILRIAEFLLGHGLYLSLYAVALLDTIFNVTFYFFSFELNFSFLYLIVTGVALPIVWIGAATYMVRKHAPEKLYSNFLRR
jgi:phosphatidylglycerophosphate synthase